MSNPPDQHTTQELIASILAWIRQAGFSNSSSEYRPRLRINMQAGEFMLPSKGESIRSARATRVEKGREAWLLVHDDNHGTPVSRAIELRNQKTVFGRAEDADIRLVNPEVSRHHFCIEWLGTHVWQIRDLGSRNGILVNGALVQVAKLGSGDEIICSEFMFRFLPITQYEEKERLADSAIHLDFYTQTFNRQFLHCALHYFGEEKEFQELFFGIITICIHNVDEIVEQVGAGGYTLVLRSFAKKIKDLQGENNRFNPYHHHFLCHLGDGQFAALITFQRPHAPMELAERCRHALLEQQFPVLGDSCQPKFSMGIVNLSWEHLAPTLKLLGSLCPQKNTNVLDEDLSKGFQGRTWESDVTPCDEILPDDDGDSLEFDDDEPTMSRETIDQRSLELIEPDSTRQGVPERLEWTRPWYEESSLSYEYDEHGTFVVPSQRFSGAKAFLVLQNPPHQGLRVDLIDGQPAIVGRSAACTIHLNDPSVSERHARIIERLDKATGECPWVIVDQRSTNGTFVNGEKIGADRVLRNGDMIQCGNILFKFFHVFDDLLQYRKEAFRLQNLDPATGAYRYPYLQWVLQGLQRRYEKKGKPFSCLFFKVLSIEQVRYPYEHDFAKSLMETLASWTVDVLKNRLPADTISIHSFLAMIPVYRLVVVLPDAKIDFAEKLLTEIVQGYWKWLRILKERNDAIDLEAISCEYGAGDYTPILELLPSFVKMKDLSEEHAHGSSTIALKTDSPSTDEPRLVSSPSRPGPIGELRFAVTIAYREPSYEQYAGEKKNPYVWTFDIEAADEEQAKKQAIAKFRKMEALSSVGWTREIVSVECSSVI